MQNESYGGGSGAGEKAPSHQVRLLVLMVFRVFAPADRSLGWGGGGGLKGREGPGCLGLWRL